MTRAPAAPSYRGGDLGMATAARDAIAKGLGIYPYELHNPRDIRHKITLGRMVLIWYMRHGLGMSNSRITTFTHGRPENGIVGRVANRCQRLIEAGDPEVIRLAMLALGAHREDTVKGGCDGQGDSA